MRYPDQNFQNVSGILNTSYCCSGDINLHPGPVKCPCLVCSRSVRKREISCDKCGLWLHKKCKPLEAFVTYKLMFICNKCLNNENDISQNAWNLFPFADDFFCNNTIALLVEKLLMIRMKFPLRINGKFSINVVYT